MPLTVAKTAHIQQEIGYLLFYDQAINSTITPALSILTSSHSKVIQSTGQVLTELLSYVTTHLDTAILFTAKKMVLQIHSNFYYLSKSKACIQSGGHFFLLRNITHPGTSPGHHKPPPTNNAAVNTISSTINNAM